MSVPLGIDLGNLTSVLAVARNRGIDVIVNEVSNRSTPSLVAFGPKNRYIGESAKTQEISNLKNTIGSLKRLIGKSFDDPDVQIEQKYLNTKLINLNGSVAVNVVYIDGETHTFTATQLLAMYLNKLKEITKVEVKGPVDDTVLAVPVWFTDNQRRAIADSVKIAGLNPVRIINDVTAAAVGYSVFKSDIPEEKPRIVSFVDLGHSSYTVSIASVKKGELKILSSAFDKHFGGRDIDIAITEHIADIFKDKYRLDIRSNPKAYARALVAAEKAKKVLSANTSAPINIESIMNDVDVSTILKREELEELIQPLLNRIHLPIQQALTSAGLTSDKIEVVEVIGGTSRVPSIKTKLSEIFNKNLSFTLNQDEAIARGAAFTCAIHSPTLRVRPLKIEDINLNAVSLNWEKIEGENTDHFEIFPENTNYPSTKFITLYRRNDFDIEAFYSNPEHLQKGINKWIGKWSIVGVSDYTKSLGDDEKDQEYVVKIKLRQDPSGLYSAESAFISAQETFEEPIEEPEKPVENNKSEKETEIETKKETENDEEKPEEIIPKTKTVKRWVKKTDLKLIHTHNGVDDKTRNELIEKELELISQDKLVAETEHRKNALEEYIYSLRSKIEDQYSQFASEEEKDKLRKLLLDAEDWLYEDGYDTTKSQYIAKYEELASIGNVIKGRYLAKQEEERQAAQKIRDAEIAKKLAEKQAIEKAAAEKLAAEKAAAEKLAAEKATTEEDVKKKDSEPVKDAEGDVTLPDVQVDELD